MENSLCVGGKQVRILELLACAANFPSILTLQILEALLSLSCLQKYILKMYASYLVIFGEVLSPLQVDYQRQKSSLKLILR